MDDGRTDRRLPFHGISCDAAAAEPGGTRSLSVARSLRV